MRAVQVPETGGPEVMAVVEIDAPRPGRHELVIDVAAAGINFIDTYHRTGLYPKQLPFVLGAEAAGIVNAVGDDIAGWSVGDRVVSIAAQGAYAEQTLIGAGDVLAVPDGLELDLAAAGALQGFTAHYLVRDTFPVAAGDRILVHAGAGGVGGLLIQMAKIIGAEVFATVSTPAKAVVATEAGADHVITYTDVAFDDAVREITGDERPLDVVYDGVGRETFDAGLTLLRPRGTMVLFGQSSGPVPPIDLQVLARNGSLYVTRPTLGNYMGSEGARRAAEVLEWIRDGRLRVRIDSRYALDDVADAHRALEARRTTGKVLLIP